MAGSIAAPQWTDNEASQLSRWPLSPRCDRIGTVDDRDGDEPPWSPGTEAARRRLCDAVRALTPKAMLTTTGDDALSEALALVQQATAMLAASSRASRYERRSALSAEIGANEPIWETHATFGPSNPFAPPVVVDEEEPGRVVATVTFGESYEGGPGTAYGGFVAAVFDGILGRTVLSAGHLAVTRSLSVRYLRPVPLRAPLRLSAAVGAVSGRDVEVSASLFDGDRVACEAEAVFTTVGRARYEI
jgi:acyl-coenzyme A thioesterase PaaI-like protein